LAGKNPQLQTLAKGWWKLTGKTPNKRFGQRRAEHTRAVAGASIHGKHGFDALPVQNSAPKSLHVSAVAEQSLT
jgi:hypothetical protein